MTFCFVSRYEFTNRHASEGGGSVQAEQGGPGGDALRCRQVLLSTGSDGCLLSIKYFIVSKVGFSEPGNFLVFVIMSSFGIFLWSD